ncbi:uncharacterized protein CBL_07589 [Carabus blaptoides fortunei]
MFKQLCKTLFQKDIMRSRFYKNVQNSFATMTTDVEAERIVWMDLEMTGLDVNDCYIMEASALITDAQLNIIAEGPDIVIHQPSEILDNMDPWCIKQHGKTGLTEACRTSAIALEEAEKTIRILWDDEDDFDQLQTDNPTSEWQGVTIAPNEISDLLIVESSKLTQIAQTCIAENCEPVCTLQEANVSIYKTVDNNYIVLCKDAKDISPGEVTEKLFPWLNKAKRILAVTSAVAAMYQKTTSEELPPCFIKVLSTGSCGVLHAPKLESPNLVTGIAAGGL